MKERFVSATEFKAKCLACLDQIEQTGESITVTKRGRPIAILGPLQRRRVPKSPRNRWKRKARIEGDILNMSNLWEAGRSE